MLRRKRVRVTRFRPIWSAQVLQPYPFSQRRSHRNLLTGKRQIMRTIQRISLAVAILGLVLLTGENQADNPPAQDSGVDVLTRGPVHEAYASA